MFKKKKEIIQTIKLLSKLSDTLYKLQDEYSDDEYYYYCYKEKIDIINWWGNILLKKVTWFDIGVLDPELYVRLKYGEI